MSDLLRAGLILAVSIAAGYGAYRLARYLFARYVGQFVTIVVRTADGRKHVTRTFERPGSDLLRTMDEATRRERDHPNT